MFYPTAGRRGSQVAGPTIDDLLPPAGADYEAV